MNTPMILWMSPALALAIGYLLGSIPFGLLLAKFGGAGDIREIGSGNIGATNVLRTGRKGLAATTLLLDGAKGAVAVMVARHIGPDLAALGGIAAFIGHLYPVWLRFKGGKGVATMLGVTLAMNWPVGLIFAAVWIGMLALARMSSLAGMSAAVAAPVAAIWRDDLGLVPLAACMALLVLWKHRANIGRLLAGTEPRIGQKG